MTDTSKLIQEPLVDKEQNEDPEYKRLMEAFTDNPFHDITKDSIKEFNDKREPKEEKEETQL